MVNLIFTVGVGRFLRDLAYFCNLSAIPFTGHLFSYSIQPDSSVFQSVLIFQKSFSSRQKEFTSFFSDSEAKCYPIQTRIISLISHESIYQKLPIQKMLQNYRSPRWCPDTLHFAIWPCSLLGTLGYGVKMYFAHRNFGWFTVISLDFDWFKKDFWPNTG